MPAAERWVMSGFHTSARNFYDGRAPMIHVLLAVIILGIVSIAIFADIAAIVAWLRGRWEDQ
jgi:hypothetical protein